MNERIKELARQSGATDENGSRATTVFCFTEQELKGFAELIVQDYAKQLVQANMSNPEYAKAMNEYYEQKWAHRFD
jgi:hypothetical protein